jgi:hypothetical protein
MRRSRASSAVNITLSSPDRDAQRHRIAAARFAQNGGLHTL